jgi:uncharacterized protein YecT (DUF1311 family)
VGAGRFGLVVMGFVMVVGAVRAQGADCARARTAQEKAVCSDGELKALDGRLARAYAALRVRLTPEAFAEVRDDQRYWVGTLPKECYEGRSGGDGKPVGRDGMVACLKENYDVRVRQLTTEVYPAAGRTIFTRQNATGTWLEMDGAGADGQAWTKAFRAELKRLSEEDEVPDDDESYSDVSYTVTGATDWFVGVEFEKSSYFKGAAHPNSTEESLEWWLKERRSVKATDVFAAGSGWEAELTKATVEALRGDAEMWDDGLFHNKTEAEDIAAVVKDPTGWTRDREGLTITFPVYSIAPHSSGMPEARVHWGRLKEVLAKGFVPERLPARK